MKSKTLIALVMIVCLPLIILGWFGLRSAKNEQKLLERRAMTLVDAQLKSIDGSIQDFFRSLQKDLAQVPETLSHEAEAVRSFIRTAGRVRQVFIFDRQNKRLYPPAEGDLTGQEEKFLERSRWVWSELGISDQEDIFPETGQRAQSSAKIARKQNADQSRPDDRILARGTEGWFVWFTGGEMSHIFWRRDDAGLLYGFEMDPPRMAADLIGRLPDTGEEEDNFRIRMVDSQGRSIYQWGGYEPEEDGAPLSMLPLTHPLGSWKLEYFGPGFTLGAELQWLKVVAILLSVGAALFGLAFYLYREHTREMALAQQRVSFVGQVSHELRSPLTNIRLYAELLDQQISDVTEESQEKSKSQKYIGVIVSESQRLSRLIANVLNFSTSAKKRLKLRPKAGRADEIIMTIIEAFRPTLESRGVKIHLDLRASDEVRIDADALEQILGNVLSNIEKYGASGARVDVESRHSVDRTIIKVSDYGPGIPHNERQKIFLPFYRVSSRLTDGVAGAGIGLSIARELAQLHGGDLTLQSAPRGACFQIELYTPEPGT